MDEHIKPMSVEDAFAIFGTEPKDEPISDKLTVKEAEKVISDNTE